MNFISLCTFIVSFILQKFRKCVLSFFSLVKKLFSQQFIKLLKNSDTNKYLFYKIFYINHCRNINFCIKNIYDYLTLHYQIF